MKRIDELLEMKTEYQSITPPPELEDRIREAMDRARAVKAREQIFAQMKQEYLSREVPAELEEKVHATVRRASMARRKNQTFKVIRNIGVAAAAAVTVFILPNSNTEVASAMGNIPILGGLIQAVTISNYTKETARTDLEVVVPEVVEEEKDKKPSNTQSAGVKKPDVKPDKKPAKPEEPAKQDEKETSGDGVAVVNEQVQAYIQTLLEEYRKDATTGGYVSLATDYRVVTDTEDWFTLEISATISKADSTTRLRYYHIDKHTGKVATLKDAFYDDVEWKGTFNSAIEKQIAERRKAGEEFFSEKEEKLYGRECTFKGVTDDSNFYFNEDGDLVIVIDSGEIAPESTGTLLFTVKASAFKEKLRYYDESEKQTSSGKDEEVSEGTGTTETPAQPVEGDDEIDDRKPENSSGKDDPEDAEPQTETEAPVEETVVEHTVAPDTDDEVDVVPLQMSSVTDGDDEMVETADAVSDIVTE